LQLHRPVRLVWICLIRGHIVRAGLKAADCRLSRHENCRHNESQLLPSLSRVDFLRKPKKGFRVAVVSQLSTLDSARSA